VKCSKRCRVDLNFEDNRDPLSYEFTLDDLPYPEHKLTNGNTASVIFDFGDDSDRHFMVKSARITILETYKGSKYNDTCIS